MGTTVGLCVLRRFVRAGHPIFAPPMLLPKQIADAVAHLSIEGIQVNVGYNRHSDSGACARSLCPAELPGVRRGMLLRRLDAVTFAQLWSSVKATTKDGTIIFAFAFKCQVRGILCTAPLRWCKRFAWPHRRSITARACH
jgi:hypothetical protein